MSEPIASAAVSQDQTLDASITSGPSSAPPDPKPSQSDAAPRPRPNTTLHSAAADEATILHRSAQPAIDTALQTASPNSQLHQLLTSRPHVRTPSAGLSPLKTDIPTPRTSTTPKGSPKTPHIVENKAEDTTRSTEAVPITIQGAKVRRALSTASMASSLSPGSALSSPALAALTDITPLPSPLVVDDSPGPWQRASHARPASRGSSSLPRDDTFAMLSNGTLSPSNSRRRKGYTYSGLKPSSAEASSAYKNEASHGRNRSLSEIVPDTLLNARPRHVTVSDVPGAKPVDQAAESHLHRERYLAEQRGLTQRAPVGATATLPTPPPSNASNRSTTESESEEPREEEPPMNYLTVREGPEKKKVRYRPLHQLGQGTFSKVVLATSENVSANLADPTDASSLDQKRLVAIKIVEHGPAGGADEERVELSLKREVEMLKSVRHPSLVHLRAFDCDDDKALLVLTYCPGGDLFDLASEHRAALTPQLIQRIFAELVGAVRYLHKHYIVHRDIKLENVLVNIPTSDLRNIQNPQTYPYPLVTLTDLGLSRPIPRPPASPMLQTRCGSEDYAAPEILLGNEYDGRSTDAWALGVLLYALMEHQLPFDPPPGKRAPRSKTSHRVARVDWGWWKHGDDYGNWDDKKGEGLEGARDVVDSLLKKVSRGRKKLEDIEQLPWVQEGIQVEGGLQWRPEDKEALERKTVENDVEMTNDR